MLNTQFQPQTPKSTPTLCPQYLNWSIKCTQSQQTLIHGPNIQYKLMQKTYKSTSKLTKLSKSYFFNALETRFSPSRHK